ncbi:hypothetical protein Syun_019908 [Stephania yunnanensis]|uniref:Uncharacterized protein n=1 Tax=Stephania yunnanensis TaxID=152371 RepID=A0AAP0NZV3_9MAGN
MGNCTFRGFGAGSLASELLMIKVMTSNGGIMELFAPITAECVTNEFPGHGIFRSADLFSRPLPHNEELRVGELYYLLPLNTCRGARITRHGHIRPTCLDYSSSSSSLNNAPYRISVDNQGLMTSSYSSSSSSSSHEVFRRCGSSNGSGIWKVKLVISPEQLSEILSKEASTEALIDSVRAVAKCGSGTAPSSTANSDQWSLSSSWKASSEHYLA